MVTTLSIAACIQTGAPQQQGAQQGDATQQTSPLYTQPDSNADDAKTADNAQTANDNDSKATIDMQAMEEALNTDSPAATDSKIKVKEQGQYTDKDRVALYIHTYGHLPDNYITKAEAQQLGWDNTLGNLKKVAPGKSIGGDRFGNYEGQLPKASKRKYFECDIDYKSGKRNAKRIVFSNDGLVFYTDDHYKTFQQLY